MPIRISGSTGISGLDGSASAPVYAGANTNVGLFVSGNTVNVSATSLAVGNTVVSNSGVSVGGIAVSQYSGMMKNRIINGDMRIDQRFNGAANNNINGNAVQHVVDRWWGSGTVGPRLRFQRNNTNGPSTSDTQLATGFPNYFGANTISSNTVNAGDMWRMSQVIEGFNIADLAWGTASASPVTLSFWSYSSVPGTHGGSIVNILGNRSYPFAYTINTANTWQYQTITIPGDTTGSWNTVNDVGMYLFYDLGYGSNWQQSAGSWYSGNYQTANGTVKIVNNANGSFYLTGVQLEKGSQATAFDFRHYTTELQLCQRYYFQYCPPNTDFQEPVFRTGTTTADMNIIVPVTMRVTPSLVLGSSPYGRLVLYDTAFSITTVNVTAMGISPVSSNSFIHIGIATSSAAGTAGVASSSFDTNAISSGIGLTAELAVQN